MKVRLHKSNSHLIPKWKKNQSSSSNPSKTKHRDAAKLKLLASLPSSNASTMDLETTTKNKDFDRLSQHSKTTIGTTATNATMIQVTPRVLQVKFSLHNDRSTRRMSPSLSLLIRLYSIDNRRKTIKNRWSFG